jgi:predicted metal-binding protein
LTAVPSAVDELRDRSDPDGSVTVLVCSTCRAPDAPSDAPRAGALLLEQTRLAASDSAITVKAVACLGNCKRSLSASILKAGSWSYVFGDLTTGSAADLLAGAHLYAASSDAIMPFRGRPEALKRGLVARIPPLNVLKDLP